MVMQGRVLGLDRDGWLIWQRMAAGMATGAVTVGAGALRGEGWGSAGRGDAVLSPP